MRQMLDSSLQVLPFPPFLAPCICNTRNANCSGHGSLEHGSVPAGASIIGGGDVEEQKWDAFYETFSCVQQEASTKRGDRRSAANGRQGHQFTPAMIDALLREALTAHEQVVGRIAFTRSKEFVPRGGFTDVGQHTGGYPRNTAWPLACEVFKVRKNMSEF